MTPSQALVGRTIRYKLDGIVRMGEVVDGSRHLLIVRPMCGMPLPLPVHVSDVIGVAEE